MPQTRIRTLVPWIAVLTIVIAAAFQLRFQGRSWICTCGHFRFWLSSAWSAETSQQLFDPYSFTHVLHGLALFGLLALAIPKLLVRWRFVLAILFEALWEIVENTNLVIERYRAMTAALGYNGDSVINSLGDLLACGVGFWLAYALGLRRSIILFLIIEAALLLTIKDSLLLNILMLIFKLDGIKLWQAAY